MIKKILIPGRLQTDTLVSIFLLRKFGLDIYPGVDSASIEIDPNIKQSDAPKDYLLVDVGGSEFDHHNRSEPTISSRLVAEKLGMSDSQTILKLLTLAERCDVYGKGINSSDLVDQAFGVPGLLLSLNRQFSNNANKVYDGILPCIEAHFEDEKHRLEELPKVIEEKIKSGDVVSFNVLQNSKSLKVIVLSSDDSVMPGFLRSSVGGGYDVVAQWMNSGHLNIITKQVKRVDLRSLAALIRKSEGLFLGQNIDDMDYLATPGRIKEISNWYFDPATNTLQNGGINPKSVVPTKIPRDSFVEILKMGLEEKLWKPNGFIIRK